MSWSATKYAWKCSHRDASGHEIVKGSVKLTMLAVAYQIPLHRYESGLVSLRDFHVLTGLQERQLRTCRQTLIDLEELEQRGAGQFATYLFPKMLGPLFVAADERAELGKDCRPSRQRLPTDSAKIAGQSGENAGGVLSLDLLKNTVLTTTTAGVEVAAAVEFFLDWFITEYPKHRGGVLYRIHPPAGESVVRDLLMGRSVARLQAMALEMWTRPDAWIRQTKDYGLYILKHRATQLETAVVEARPPAVMGPLAPPTVWDAVCRELKAVVSRDTFHTWVVPLKLVEDRESVLVVEAPTAIHVEWVEKYFGDVLRAAASHVRPGTAVVVQVAA